MSVVVRMAPSPTGFLHIGNVRTALFNWLFARNEGGEFHLRIENTDTSREVAEATEQIQESLRWLGLDWDGPVTFQLDRMEQCAEVGRQLLAGGEAYEDDGAIRFRMPDEGVTAWDDLVVGRVEVPNKEIEDLVLVRSDGRPTYNFASPLEDVWDGITHVLRGPDHISNTPKQINILQALGAEIPLYGHVPNVNGADGKKLSKRHGAVTVEEFRADGYVADALLNFLALLGWSYDDKTTIMSRAELVERFSLERVGASPATFDYDKLDWMNGVYLRALPAEQYADELVAYLHEQGHDWPADRIRAAAPLVQAKIERLGQFPEYAGFLFRPVTPDPSQLNGSAPLLQAAADELAGTEPFDAEHVEGALRALADRLGLKPRDAFAPIRVAVTGSKVSPGLFESIELLGRDETLSRLAAAAG
ncbi:MAG TPA: glutamate--tRNA ligase [Gaiellaceae bacterium]|nr:glutamate--tRNA ligase [Gaiellaceae bacterium]